LERNDADIVTYRLPLRDIRDFFVAPEPNPFDPCLDVSGVDALVNQINAGSLRRAARIEILLPPEQITPDLAARTRAALASHLAIREQWARNEVRGTRQIGYQSLKYALVLTVLVILLMAVAYFLELPTWLQLLAYAVFIVVAWVSLWWAVETILFDWLQSHRLGRVLRVIGDADLSIQPITEPGGSPVVEEIDPEPAGP
jgi:hypothetical protein